MIIVMLNQFADCFSPGNRLVGSVKCQGIRKDVDLRFSGPWMASEGLVLFSSRQNAGLFVVMEEWGGQRVMDRNQRMATFFWRSLGPTDRWSPGQLKIAAKL